MNAGKLPDDIEEFLLNGQRLRATVELSERRRISIEDARDLVGRWLFERQRRREDL